MRYNGGVRSLGAIGLVVAVVGVLALAGCSGRAGVGVASSAISYCAGSATVKGIDVSHYDGAIDWAAVAGAGIGFAFMKATEGTTLVDSALAANWKGAGAHGVVRGAYHFFHPASDAVAQADFFVATAGVPAPGDLPLTLDLEADDGLKPADVAAAARTFLARVADKSGRTPIVYTSTRFFDTVLGGPAGFDGYTLWDAQWTTACPNVPTPAWSAWRFWQYSATGTVPGIAGSGNVDLDEFDGTVDELRAFAAGATPPDGGSADDGGMSPGGSDGGSDGGAAEAHEHGGCSVGGGPGAGSLGGGGGSGPWLLALALAVVVRRRTRRSRDERHRGRGATAASC